jgi:S1-C subfamily serine protease/predicted esterase
MTSQSIYFRLCVLATFASLFVGTFAFAQDVTEQEEAAFKAAVKQASASVVRVETFGGLEKVGQLLVGTGPTTGLVVAADGYILSSAFNFVQKPSSILVTLPNGTRKPAKIISRDNHRMLVLLKVETETPLTVPTAVPRDQMMVGQWTFAVGRTFDLDSVNTSVGILSAKNRIWGKALQTDAKISPSNYGGPLIDLQGRVLGILVPLSPQGKGDIAGAEWYDSGIGFAVPLDEINKRLDVLKSGKDLNPGVLGVALKGKDVYADNVFISSVRINSPAHSAGIQVNDKIVSANGLPVVRQAQLKHVLGGLYAGDTVKIGIKRGSESLEMDIELTDKLTAYEFPFMGILPERVQAGDGVNVRFVFPGSGADEAQIKAADRITKIGEEAVTDSAQLLELMAGQAPENEVDVTLVRGEETMVVKVKLGTIPNEVPESVPAIAKPEGEEVAAQTVELEFAEERNKCFAYIPSTYRNDAPHGVLVWLHGPSGYKEADLEKRFKELCEKYQVILLAPQAGDGKKFSATDVDFCGKAIQKVIADYTVDGNRIATHGYQAGGSMAYLVAFGQRALVHGVSSVDGGFPTRIGAPENDPAGRILIHSTVPTKSKLAQRLELEIKKLRSLKFPVTELKVEGEAKELNAEQLLQLGSWLDTLDRI